MTEQSSPTGIDNLSIEDLSEIGLSVTLARDEPRTPSSVDEELADPVLHTGDKVHDLKAAGPTPEGVILDKGRTMSQEVTVTINL